MNYKILLIGIMLLLAGGCANTSLSVTDTSGLDFLNGCSFDTIVGTDCLVLSAHNPDVDNSGTKEDIWEGGGLMVYLTTAQKYNISSTSTDDDFGGIGITTLFVRGLNSTFDIVDEVIIMDGTTTVQTVNEYIRPVFLAGVGAGSAENNLGIITATSAITGDLQIQMDEDEGLSKNSQFTVPRGQTMIIKKVQISATKSGGQSPIVQVKGRIRFFGTNVWIETFDFKLDTSVSDSLVIDQPISNMIAERADFRIEVTTTTDNVDVTSRSWLIFRSND